MDQIKTYFNWSSGKDAAMAYYKLSKDPAYSIDKLITTINNHHDRVSMHGLKRELLEAQINEIGLPFDTIELPKQPDMPTYEKAMSNKVFELKTEGFTHCGFGDIFLEDLKEYRAIEFQKMGVECVFPIWKNDTVSLIESFVSDGFKAIVICANDDLTGESIIGQEIDENFISKLPKGVDPCGENGEFHTFCYDGPIFSNPVNFEIGERVYRKYDSPEKGKPNPGYWFQDLALSY